MKHILSGLAVALWAAAAVAEPLPGIVVTGRADVAVAPDMARLVIGVEHRAADAVAAIDAMSAGTEAVLARLAAAGLDGRDVQTSSLRLDLERDYSGNGVPRIVGYVASTRIDIAVRELDALGRILGEVVGDGANRIDSLSFDVADPAPHREAARRAAVADARAKAQLYAEAAGVTLGKLQHLTEAGGGGMPEPFGMEARSMAAADVPVAAGEIEISASVTLSYAIAE